MEKNGYDHAVSQRAIISISLGKLIEFCYNRLNELLIAQCV
jgi:hypothetical protein